MLQIAALVTIISGRLPESFSAIQYHLSPALNIFVRSYLNRMLISSFPLIPMENAQNEKVTCVLSLAMKIWSRFKCTIYKKVTLCP